jgi:hypothetical protein
MSDFVSNYWSFLPYLTLVSFLAVMSILEKPGKTNVQQPSRTA